MEDLGWTLGVNLLIFVAIFSCCTLHHWLDLRKSPTPRQSLSHAIWAGVINPATIDSIKDFLAYLLVSSGYIIPTP